MTELILKAQIRDIFGKKVKKLRKEGFIPGEVYGHNVSNKHIFVSKKDFLKVFKEAHENTVIQLDLDGEKIPVLISYVGYNYLNGEVETVDFHQLKMGEKIEVNVPVELKGESQASKKGFMVIKTLNEIRVLVSPTSIPHSFEIDVTSLKDLGDKITVKDVKFPQDIKVLVPSDTVIVSVVESTNEEISENKESSLQENEAALKAQEEMSNK
jgi:large subunit ribosomal protein L25